jgi:hypothetical protein
MKWFNWTWLIGSAGPAWSGQTPPWPIALSLSLVPLLVSQHHRTPPSRRNFPAALDPFRRWRGEVQVRLDASYNSLQFDLPPAAASPRPCLRKPSTDQTDAAASGLPLFCRLSWCCHGPPRPRRPPRRLRNGSAGLQPRRLLHSIYSRCCCHWWSILRPWRR